MKENRESLREKWRRFRRLSWEDRSFVVQAMAALPLTSLALRAMGFRKSMKLIDRLSTPARGEKTSDRLDRKDLATRIVRAVRSAELHGPATPNCLERSMALWWMLRRAGIESHLRIGARKTDSEFQAHAWVELAGQILNDSTDVHKHYARFDAPIAAALTDSDQEFLQ